jgi:hypothetical protein
MYHVNFARDKYLQDPIRSRQIGDAISNARKPKIPSISTTNKIYLKKIKEKGIIKLDNAFTQKDADKTVDFFSRLDGYDAHVPIYSKSRIQFSEANRSETGYISYSTEQVLNNKVITNFIEQDPMRQVLEEYLGEDYSIYSVNTWWTLPREERLLTHGFHRDEDDFKFLVIFIYWTDVSIGDGHFEFIEKTHKLESIDKLPGNPNRLKKIQELTNTTNGYGRDDLYLDIYQKENTYLSGARGSAFMADTWGLHRGSPVIKPRLVTWLRYGQGKNFTLFNDKPFFDEGRLSNRLGKRSKWLLRNMADV